MSSSGFFSSSSPPLPPSLHLSIPPAGQRAQFELPHPSSPPPSLSFHPSTLPSVYLSLPPPSCRAERRDGGGEERSREEEREGVPDREGIKGLRGERRRRSPSVTDGAFPDKGATFSKISRPFVFVVYLSGPLLSLWPHFVLEHQPSAAAADCAESIKMVVGRLKSRGGTEAR